MRILAIGQRNSGVSYHRLMLPTYYLKKEYALLTDTINDEILSEGFDVVVINRFIQDIRLDELIAYKEKYGFKLVVDIDDFWLLDSWHLLYRVYPTREILAHIVCADVVTCTNELLYNEIKPLNPNVHIVPNALPYGLDQFTDERTQSDKVRFIYAGGLTHEKDLNIIQFPLKRVASDSSLKDKVQFELCGFSDEHEGVAKLWHRMIANFTANFKIGIVRKELAVTEYMNFYANADVTFAPLVPTKFNSMKSNLKVLEAGAKKIPILVSNTAPYDTCPYAIKINQQTEWYKEIKKLANDSIYRQEVGLANYEWCKENFDLLKINQLREQIYAN